MVAVKEQENCSYCAVLTLVEVEEDDGSHSWGAQEAGAAGPGWPTLLLNKGGKVKMFGITWLSEVPLADLWCRLGAAAAARAPRCRAAAWCPARPSWRRCPCQAAAPRPRPLPRPRRGRTHPRLQVG